MCWGRVRFLGRVREKGVGIESSWGVGQSWEQLAHFYGIWGGARLGDGVERINSAALGTSPGHISAEAELGRCPWMLSKQEEGVWHTRERASV